MCTSGVLGGRRLTGWLQERVEEAGGSVSEWTRENVGEPLLDLGTDIGREWHNVMDDTSSAYHDAKKFLEDVGHTPCLTVITKMFSPDDGTPVNFGASHSMPQYKLSAYQKVLTM